MNPVPPMMSMRIGFYRELGLSTFFTASWPDWVAGVPNSLRRLLDLERQPPRPLNVGGPRAPRFVTRGGQGHGASLDNSAEVAIAVVTFESDSGGAVCLGRIEDQDEGAELNSRHAVILKLWFQLPDSVEPIERCTKVADTEVNVI